MTLHDVLRAIVRSDGALLNDARWVENAVRAIAAHEAKYPSPAVTAPPADPRDAEIEALKAQLAAASAPVPVQDAVPDPRDAEIAALRAQLGLDATAEGSPG